MNDAKERSFWKDYMRAYEDMFTHTSTKRAPWYIIPADNKWFMRLAVAAIVHQTLEDLESAVPEGLQGKARRAAEDAGSPVRRERLAPTLRRDGGRQGTHPAYVNRMRPTSRH